MPQHFLRNEPDQSWISSISYLMWKVAGKLPRIFRGNLEVFFLCWEVIKRVLWGNLPIKLQIANLGYVTSTCLKGNLKSLLRKFTSLFIFTLSCWTWREYWGMTQENHLQITSKLPPNRGKWRNLKHFFLYISSSSPGPITPYLSSLTMCYPSPRPLRPRPTRCMSPARGSPARVPGHPTFQEEMRQYGRYKDDGNFYFFPFPIIVIEIYIYSSHFCSSFSLETSLLGSNSKSKSSPNNTNKLQSVQQDLWSETVRDKQNFPLIFNQFLGYFKDQWRGFCCLKEPPAERAFLIEEQEDDDDDDEVDFDYYGVKVQVQWGKVKAEEKK